jgi:glycosyltransferase involved in cell wall biosynthesis/ubiquinone/menaquinone biosynthesis C-methylase UbiE
MRCLYLAHSGALSVVDEPLLDEALERHKVKLAPKPYAQQGDAIDILQRDDSLRGLVIEMFYGWMPRNALLTARRALNANRRVWIYFPAETAVEHIDRERLSSGWRHYFFVNAYRLARRVFRGRSETQDPQLKPAARLARLDDLYAAAAAVPFPEPRHEPSPAHPIAGCGAYLRTDFWSKIESGGSYGHTCYVARELAAVSERFVAFMAHRYRLLDDFGVRQVVLDAPSDSGAENEIVRATDHYLRLLTPAFEALRPSYIYERLVLGNFAGAILSQRLQIPYIVEYNGSEISMRRSYEGSGYIYETEYLKAEALAFKQATMISVVSAEVQKTLIARGIDPRKILVNPNGADLAAYAPAQPAEKTRLRDEAGLERDAPIVGFTGTFGGWHGIDVLAEAIPQICRAAPEAQFLLIGDGNFKHLVDTAVATHGLHDRVISKGRVPQDEGARLLKACDIYVSPHSSHMVDSKFFGSPTKIFEYMAMGGGIVASDLEQIGQVLSPALGPTDFAKPQIEVTNQRAVLCTPGDVSEFVTAVVGLLQRPALWGQLGANSRQAVADHYSWTRHVARLWPFLASESLGAHAPAIRTGDAYKDQVQKQWDNDPAGSHYVKAAEPHTLDWFREAEAYRYGEYAPWMHETMEFARHPGKELLEIGGGMGTDLAQFAAHGARVTDLDLSSGHLELAKENFKLRGLTGEFVLHDAEKLPFDDNRFDVVYSNGVIHHTPNTRSVVREIRRVLKPGGRAIVMVYAENSLHYWRNLVWAIGLRQGQLADWSMGEIMSRSVERSDNAGARPLVKVYTRRRLRELFAGFEDIQIVQRQMVGAEKPRLLQRVPLPLLGQLMGWNLIIKARKSHA